VGGGGCLAYSSLSLEGRGKEKSGHLLREGRRRVGILQEGGSF